MLKIKNLSALLILFFGFQFSVVMAQVVVTNGNFNCTNGTVQQSNCSQPTQSIYSNTPYSGVTVPPQNSYTTLPSNTSQKYPDLCSVLTRTIGIGDEGQDVRRLQVVLGQEGIAYINATGYFGPTTRNAVKVFQLRNGFQQTGGVGTKTLARMRSLWCGGTTTQYPTTPSYPSTPTTGPLLINISAISSNGNNVTLGWNTTGAYSCTLNNENVPVNGQKVYPVYQETTFVMNCLGYNNVRNSKTIYVRPDQVGYNLPTINFKINPTTPLINSTASLEWYTTNAYSCTLNGQNVSTNGNQQIYVTYNNQSYTLTCLGQNGKSTSSTIYPATGTPNGITSASISVNNSNISSGSGTTLNWNSSNASSCTVSGGGLNFTGLSGAQTIYPTQTTTYTVNCYGNNSGNITNQVTVYVNNTTSGTVTANQNTDAISYRNQVGQTINFYCPAGLPATPIWGDSIYSDDSPICTAAVHAGVISFANGGNVSIVIGSAQNTFSSSTKNGVTSQSFGYWPGSFTILNSGTSTNTTQVSVDLTANKSTVNLGESITYTATVRNNGSTNVRFQNDFGMCTSNDVTLKIDNGDYNTFFFLPLPSCQFNPNFVPSYITLTPGQSYTRTFTATVPNTSTNIVGSHTATATLTLRNESGIFDTKNSNSFTFTISNSGSNTGSVTANLSANPTSYTTGNMTPVTLTWSSTNANYCNLTGNGSQLFNNQNTSGTFTVYPSISTNYVLNCYNYNGQNAASYVYVTANNNNNGGTLSVNLSASNQSPASGQAVTLSWYSSNASSCTLSANNNTIATNQPTSGTYLVYPTQNTNYQITCINNTNNISVSAYVYVTVNGSSNSTISLISNNNRTVTVQIGGSNTGGYCAQVINAVIYWGDGQNQLFTSCPGSILTHQYYNSGNFNIYTTSNQNNTQTGNLQVYVQ